MSTVPVVTTVTVPEASAAVAPASVYVVPSSTVAGLVPVTVTTGSIVSTTFTVLVAVPVLPEASEALYVIVYVPTVEVSTVPLDVTVPSVVVAPASVYVVPSSTLAGLVPVTVTTGSIVSTTFTVLFAYPVLPELSVAL